MHGRESATPATTSSAPLHAAVARTPGGASVVAGLSSSGPVEDEGEGANWPPSADRWSASSLTMVVDASTGDGLDARNV